MKVVAWLRPFTQELPAHLPEEIDLVTVRDEEQFVAALPGTEAVITPRWREQYFDHADRVEWLQSTSAGVNHLPLKELAEHGIRVTTASGVHPEPIAEHVYGYLLGIERGLFAAQHQKETRTWEAGNPQEVAGGTMTIVGVGAIGAMIAEKASVFDLTVNGVDTVQDCPAVDAWYPPERLPEALAAATYVVLACPLTAETTGLIGAAELEAMPDEAILVNIARGRVVDQDALVAALEQGTIRAAALDVFDAEPLPEESPLWDMDNVVITPHNAGATPFYAERLAAIFEDNLAAFKNDERMLTQV